MIERRRYAEWSREVGIVSLLVVLAAVSFLFSPRVPRALEDAHCVTVNDWGPIHLTKNCDSEEFQYLARDPSLMFTREHKTRQNRPLYAALGWVVAAPLRAPGLETFGARILGRQDRGPVGPGPGTYFPEYAAFVLINLVLLVASVMLFRRLLGAESLLPVFMVLPVTMLLINEVTKAFFWTPHQQIFNVFVPLLSIALYRGMQQRQRELSLPLSLAIGVGIGVASLAYGVFAVTVAGGVLALTRSWGNRTFRERAAWTLSRSAALLVGFFAPVAAWMALVIARTGSFYSQEIDLFRQFVWISDFFRSGGPGSLGPELMMNLFYFGEVLAPVVAFPLSVLSIAIVVRRTLANEPSAGAASGNLSRPVLWFIVADVTFFALLGTYETRLAWSVVPAILVLLAVEIRRIEGLLPGVRRALLHGAVFAVSAGYSAYWILRSGPYS